jgi:TetR/AcrR family transcriptional regulator, repressor for uid operon
VSRRKITVELAPMMGAFNTVASADSSVEHILDAGADLMLRYGLTRWSMEDVAERAAIGRTTVYRSFAARDELVHAVLARELRATIGRITAAAAAADSPEDGIVEGALTGLAALRSSLVEKLLESDPGTVLPFLTTSAGPLVALTSQLLVAQAGAAGATIDDAQAQELAEIAARLGLSFILTRDTVFPVDDEEALRQALRRLLRPILAPLFGAAPAAR